MLRSGSPMLVLSIAPHDSHPARTDPLVQHHIQTIAQADATGNAGHFPIFPSHLMKESVAPRYSC